MTRQVDELCAPRSPLPPLAGAELLAWIALRRVRVGGVAQCAGRYYDHGRRVPCFLPDVFDQLLEAGLLISVAPDPDNVGLHRVMLTDVGHARFTELAAHATRCGQSGKTAAECPGSSS